MGTVGRSAQSRCGWMSKWVDKGGVEDIPIQAVGRQFRLPSTAAAAVLSRILYPIPPSSLLTLYPSPMSSQAGAHDGQQHPPPTASLTSLTIPVSVHSVRAPPAGTRTVVTSPRLYLKVLL